jgi:hypothetical protein
MFDPLGREVIAPMVVSGTNGTNYVNVALPEDLSGGVYMLQITCGDRVWTRSVVKSAN